MAMRALILAVLGLAAVACVGPRAERATFLDEAVARGVTTDHIVQAWGVPHGRASLSDGGQVWTYQFTRTRYVEGTGGSRCENYHLTFDPRGRLQRWVRQRC